MKSTKHKIGVGGAVITPYHKKLVNQVLDSGRLSYGPMLQRFESEFAKVCGRKYAISSNSGTSSLQVAVHALKDLGGWRDGDEILVPAITFIATPNVVLQNGLKPVFVDVDPKMYHIDPKKIEELITKRTRAIMPVHLFGISCDMDPILHIAKKYKLRVIEDSCEAVGVHYKKRPVGSLGDIACFSTYMAHLVTTGVGGFAATNDPKIAVKIRSLVNHGRDSIYLKMDDDKGVSGRALFRMANSRFSFISTGYSYRLTELEGALGVAELKYLQKNIRTRQAYASHLLKGLKPYEKYLQLPSWPAHSEHAFMMFPLVVKNLPAGRQVTGISRNKLIHWLESNGVETRYLLPLINQPVYKKIFGDLEPKYPAAAYLNKYGFYIGCHPELGKKDLNHVISVFKDFFSQKGIG